LWSLSLVLLAVGPIDAEHVGDAFHGAEHGRNVVLLLLVKAVQVLVSLGGMPMLPGSRISWPIGGMAAFMGHGGKGGGLSHRC
jgi:hypothetical protein